jgi:Fe-S oxidoreductase
MYYLAIGDPRFVPGRKVGLVESIYRRYNTVAGRSLPALSGARELDDGTAAELVDQLFGACTLCGRCSMHCSVGVDVPLVVKAGRRMLAAMGAVPETLQSTVNTALKTGNNMGITAEELTDTLSWLEEELRAEVNDPAASIPLDRAGADVLYTLNPREPKFFPLSIAAMAKIFHAAREDWTLSTAMYDVTNYAYFSCNLGEAGIIARRLYDEMLALRARRCVLAECGHGSRAFRWEAPNYLRTEFPFDVLTSVELIGDYIRSGRIRLDPTLNRETVTLHDPCNLVREGGVVGEQRFILGHAVEHFIEMTPHGVDNFCCGGGGGQLAMSEYAGRRMKIAEIKAEQIRRTGAKVVVSPCHNCVDQLMQINAAFGLGVKVQTLAETVADALILTRPGGRQS